MLSERLPYYRHFICSNDWRHISSGIFRTTPKQEVFCFRLCFKYLVPLGRLIRNIFSNGFHRWGPTVTVGVTDWFRAEWNILTFRCNKRFHPQYILLSILAQSWWLLLLKGKLLSHILIPLLHTLAVKKWTLERWLLLPRKWSVKFTAQKSFFTDSCCVFLPRTFRQRSMATLSCITPWMRTARGLWPRSGTRRTPLCSGDVWTTWANAGTTCATRPSAGGEERLGGLPEETVWKGWLKANVFVFEGPTWTQRWPHGRGSTCRCRSSWTGWGLKVNSWSRSRL